MNSLDNQGILGEAAVLKELLIQGYDVFTQFSGKSPFDIVAYKDSVLYRVSVKSTSRKVNNSYIVELRRKRHNTTTSIDYGFDNTSCDILAVYIAPVDKVIFYKASDINTGTISVRL